MKNSDIGLGSVALTSSAGDTVILRVSIWEDIFKIEISKDDNKILTLHLEDDSDISNLISLLESCLYVN